MGRILIVMSMAGAALLVVIVVVALLALAGVDRFDVGFKAAS